MTLWKPHSLIGRLVCFSYAANGGKASSKGLELTTSYRVADGLRVGGTLAYTDAHLTEDAPALGGLNGDRLPQSPRWSGSLTVDYDHALDDHRALSFSGGYRYQGRVYNDVQSASDAEPVKRQSVFDVLFDSVFPVCRPEPATSVRPRTAQNDRIEPRRHFLI